MPSREQRWFLSCLWALVSLVGVAIGTLTTFVLYTQLNINSYSVTKHWPQLLGGLALCGAVQGLVLAGLQTTVLLAARLNFLKWLATSVVSMALGMSLPMMHAVLLYSAPGQGEFPGVHFDSYTLGGWALSWTLSGMTCGAISGQNTLQAVGRSLINTAAYVLLGTAAFVALFFAISPGPPLGDAPPTPLTFWLFGLAWVVVGTWLSIYVFRGMSQPHQG